MKKIFLIIFIFSICVFGQGNPSQSPYTKTSIQIDNEAFDNVTKAYRVVSVTEQIDIGTEELSGIFRLDTILTLGTIPARLDTIIPTSYGVTDISYLSLQNITNGAIVTLGGDSLSLVNGNGNLLWYGDLFFDDTYYRISTDVFLKSSIVATKVAIKLIYKAR